MLPLNVRSSREAVIKTLAFYDIFGQCLTFDEVEKNIIGMKITKDHLNICLNQVKIIDKKAGFYFLKGADSTIEKRTRNIQILEKYSEKIRRYSFIFRMSPFVKMVGICNSFSFGSPDPDSDIDLFIVARENRLFTARFFVTLFTHLLRMRRHGHKIKGRFCLSFFADENSVNMEPLSLKPYDIYLAFWVKNLLPVFGEKTYYKFIESNNWVTRYFPNGIDPRKEFLNDSGFSSKFFRRLLEKILSGKFGDKIENLLSSFMTKRALKKYEQLEDKTGTIISKHMLKFHDKEKRFSIRQRWEQKIDEFSRYF